MGGAETPSLRGVSGHQVSAKCGQVDIHGGGSGGRLGRLCPSVTADGVELASAVSLRWTEVGRYGAVWPWSPNPRSSRTGLLAAGDDGQTVRPSGFDWGALNDLLAACLDAPRRFHLEDNLRCPSRIAAVIERASQWYVHLDKSRRPTKQRHQ